MAQDLGDVIAILCVDNKDCCPSLPLKYDVIVMGKLHVCFFVCSYVGTMFT